MADEALISFETDIADVVGQIRAGLTDIEGLTQRFQSSLGNVSSNQFARSLKDIDSALAHTDGEFKQLLYDLENRSLKGTNFTARLNSLVSGLDRQIGKSTGAHGLSLELGLELRKDVLARVNTQLNAGIRDLRSKAEAGLSNIDVNLLGKVNARVETSRRSFDAGRTQGQANPVVDNGGSSGNTSVDATKLQKAIDDATREAEVVGDNLSVVNKATANAAISAGKFAAALERAAKNAEDAANHQYPPPPTPGAHGGSGGATGGGGNGAGGGGGSTVDTTGGDDDDSLKHKNPPKPKKVKAAGSGGSGDDDEPSPQQIFDAAVDEAIAKINYGLKKDSALAVAKAEELKRVAAVVAKAFTDAGVTIDQVDAQRLQAAFLRGRVVNPDGSERIREGGYSPGVEEFGPGNRRLRDTRFEQLGDKSANYLKTDTGAERYFVEQEAERRAQEDYARDASDQANRKLLFNKAGSDDVVGLTGQRAVLRGQNGDANRAFNTRTGEQLVGTEAAKAMLDFAEKVSAAEDRIANLRLLTGGRIDPGKRFNNDTVDLGSKGALFRDPSSGQKRGFKLDRDKLPVEVFEEEFRQLIAAAEKKLIEESSEFHKERDRLNNLRFLRTGRDLGEEFGAHVTRTGTSEAVAQDANGNTRAFNTRTGEELKGDEYLEALNRFLAVGIDKIKQAEAIEVLTRGRGGDQQFNDQTTRLSGNRAVTNDNGVDRAFQLDARGNVKKELADEELRQALLDYRTEIDKSAETQKKLDEATEIQRKRVEDTSRLTDTARPGQRFNDNVVEINKGLVAEYDQALGEATRFYKADSQGILTEITSRDELIRAEQDLGKNLHAEAERIFRAGQETNKQENLERLTRGAKPNTNGGFSEGVTQLTGGYVADLRGNVAEFYKKVGDGFIKLGDYSYERTVAINKLQEAQAATDAKQVAEANARRLYDADPKSRTGLIEGAKRYGGNGVTILEDGVQSFYKVIGDGLRKVEQESIEYQQELVKFNRAGGQGRSPVSAFIKGATSGGFGGTRDEGFLEGISQAAGTTLKYSALYGALNLVQQAFSQAGAEAVNFEDSNTNLAIAMENATGVTNTSAKANQEWLGTIEQISIQAGSNVGDVMDVIASGIRTIGQNADYSTSQVQSLGTEFGRQAQIMSVLAKTTITDAAGNLRAIGSAFNVPLTASARINDAYVVGKNIGGGDEKETAQAVASAGESLSAAGFSIEQSFALASRIQAATDQTGAAVGNKLSRITSIVSGSAGQAAILKANNQLPDQYKVNIAATPEEQLLALSKAYKANELSTGSVKSLTNSLGGTSSAKEFITILEQYADVASEVAKKTDTAGKADEEYQKRLQDLSQTVREFKGALSAIAVNLVQSGALDPLLEGFKALVEVLKFVAGAINELNQFRDTLGSLGVVLPTIVFLTSAVVALGAALNSLRKLGDGNLFVGVTRAATKTEEALRPRSALARKRNNQANGTDLKSKAERVEEELTQAPPAVVKPKTDYQVLYPNSPQFKKYEDIRHQSTDGNGNPDPNGYIYTQTADQQREYDRKQAEAEAHQENQKRSQEALDSRAEQTARRSGGTVDPSRVSKAEQDAYAESAKRFAKHREELALQYADTSPQFAKYETYTKPASTDANGKTTGAKTYTAEQQARDAYRKAERDAYLEHERLLNKERTQAAEKYYRQNPIVDAEQNVVGAGQYAAYAEEDAHKEKARREGTTASKIPAIGANIPVTKIADDVLPAAEKASRLKGLRNVAEIGFGLAGGPVGVALIAATVGLTALGGLKSKSDALSQAMEDAQTSLPAIADLGLTAASTNADFINAFKDQASSTKSKADAIQGQSTGFLAGFANFFTGKKDDAKVLIKQYNDQSAYAQAQSEKFANFSAEVSGGLSQLAVFGDSSSVTVDSLNQGLSTLASQAYSTQDQIKLLSTFLGLLGDTASNATGANPYTAITDEQRQRTSTLAAQKILTSQPDTVTGQIPLTTYVSGLGNLPTGQTTTGQVSNRGVQQFLANDQQKLQGSLFTASSGVAKGANGAYSDEQIAQMAQTVANQAAADWEEFYKTLTPSQRKDYAGTTAASVRAQVLKGVKDSYTPAPVDTKATVTADVGLAAVTSLQSLYESLVGETNSDAGRAKLWKKELADIDAEIAKVDPSDPGYAGLLEKRTNVASGILESSLSSAEDLRKAQQSKATTDAEVKAIGEKFFNDYVAQAAALGDVDALVGLFNEANKAEIAAARATIVGNLKVLKAQADAEKANNAAIDAAAASIDAANKGTSHGYSDTRSDEQKKSDDAKASEGKSNKAQKRYKDAKGASDSFDEAQDRSTPADSGGSIETGDDSATNQTALQKRQNKTEIAIAERNSTSLASAGLDQAQRAVNDAKDRVNDYVLKSEKNTPEYWAAIKSLNDAKVALAHTEIDSMQQLKGLGQDATDPVAVARLAAETARKQREQAEKDADASNLKGTKRADYLAPFIVNERSANAASQNTAESEYQSNLQTSLDLGRISHKRYIELLTARRDALLVEYKATKKGDEGRAQLKKLIDNTTLAIKSATDSINDQFNLGDIKVPTVYQVRRSLKAQTTGDVLGSNGAYSTAGNVTNDNSTRNVILNGVPVETILNMIQDLFGKKARTTASRRIGA